MARIIAGIAAGLIVAAALMTGIEMIGHRLYRIPAEADVRSMAAGARLFVLGAWFAGALAGGLVAAAIAERASAAWVVAALLACGGVVLIFMLPQPEILQIGAILAPALGGVVAGHFARLRLRRRQQEEAVDGR